ncbi:hypothetical protein TREES_T100002449 [Tupaia chinensis]|uniref:Uncharacterized protein n=1 Tax=Tupaia chinensis TaxID=246437 RepID=L9L9M1_TUPCH|nr:hypothetical protein TREES_T100002449 [Tupaia chinensis]
MQTGADRDTPGPTPGQYVGTLTARSDLQEMPLGMQGHSAKGSEDQHTQTQDRIEHDLLTGARYYITITHCPPLNSMWWQSQGPSPCASYSRRPQRLQLGPLGCSYTTTSPIDMQPSPHSQKFFTEDLTPPTATLFPCQVLKKAQLECIDVWDSVVEDDRDHERWE